MSGDNTGSGTGTDDGKSTDTGKTTDDSGASKPADDPALKTDDVSGLKKALADERKMRQSLEKAARDAELAKLPELERFQSENQSLTAEVEKLTLENRRYKVAMKLGLPWSLGKRLSGDTDEEMEADGADLVKSYKVDDGKKVIPDDPKNKVKTTNDAKANGTHGKKADMSAIIRALAGK